LCFLPLPHGHGSLRPTVRPTAIPYSSAGVEAGPHVELGAFYPRRAVGVQMVRRIRRTEHLPRMRKRDLHGAAVASRVIVAGVMPFDAVQVHASRWWIGP